MMVWWRRTNPEDHVTRRSRLRAGCCCWPAPISLITTFRRNDLHIVEHNDGGTLGVVLNRPAAKPRSTTSVPQWAKLAARQAKDNVHRWPVSATALCLALCGLALDPEGVPGLRHVAGRLVMVDLDADPRGARSGGGRVRIYAGIPGWTIRSARR